MKLLCLYTVGEPLPKGKKVWFVGQKPNNYACIEYSIGKTDDTNRVRVYMTTSKESPSGYCIKGGGKRFEEIAKNYTNSYYYGPDTTKFPRCNSVKFYDPYGVITSNGAVFDKC